MRHLKGWTRFNRLKDLINRDLIKAETDQRLESLAKRIQVLETSIRSMNQKNGAFLDLPSKPALRTVNELKQIQTKLKGVSK